MTRPNEPISAHYPLRTNDGSQTREGQRDATRHERFTTDEQKSPAGDARLKETDIAATMRGDIPSGARLERLPDGRQALVYGEPRRASEFNHAPGMNELGYQQTQGIVECELVLRQAGINRPERTLVNLAVHESLCEVRTKTSDVGNVSDPPASGSTTLEQRAALIQKQGVTTERKSNATVEDLAEWVKAGKTAIIPASVWQEQKIGDKVQRVQINVSCVVVGTTIDRNNPHEILGFHLLQAGGGEAMFVNTADLRYSWQEEKLGVAVVADTTKPRDAERPHVIRHAANDAVATTHITNIHDIRNLESLDPTALKASRVDALQQRLSAVSGHEIQHGRQQIGVYERVAKSEVPCFRGTFSDGREVLIVGDVQAAARGHHEQGQNSLGYEGTCSFVAMEGLLRQAGIHTSENALLHYAVEHKLCVMDAKDNAYNGGTTPKQGETILKAHGAKDYERRDIVVGDYTAHEQLAQIVEEGKGAFIGVNSGLLYGRPEFYGFGYVNHVFHITGAMRDLQTHQLLGVFVNDGNTVPGGTLLSRERMTLMFEEARDATIETIRITEPKQQPT